MTANPTKSPKLSLTKAVQTFGPITLSRNLYPKINGEMWELTPRPSNNQHYEIWGPRYTNESGTTYNPTDKYWLGTYMDSKHKWDTMAGPFNTLEAAAMAYAILLTGLENVTY